MLNFENVWGVCLNKTHFGEKRGRSLINVKKVQYMLKSNEKVCKMLRIHEKVH